MDYKEFLTKLDEQADFHAKMRAAILMKEALGWIEDEATDRFGEEADAVMAEVKKLLKDPSIVK